MKLYKRLTHYILKPMGSFAFALAFLFPLPAADTDLGLPYKVGTTAYYSCHFSAASGFSADFPYHFEVKNRKEDGKQSRTQYYIDGGGPYFSGIILGRERVWLNPPSDEFLSFLSFVPHPEIQYTGHDTGQWESLRRYIGSLALAIGTGSGTGMQDHYKYGKKEWNKSETAAQYKLMGRGDTTIGGHRYNNAFLVQATSALTHPENDRINGTKGKAFFAYTLQKGFEYMQFSLADTVHASLRLDSLVVRK